MPLNIAVTNADICIAEMEKKERKRRDSAGKAIQETQQKVCERVRRVVEKTPLQMQRTTSLVAEHGRE